MPRTSITPTDVAGGTTSQVAFTPYTWTAGDAANGNQFTGTGKDILHARNTGATPRILTLHHPRGASVTITLAASGSAGDKVTTGQIPRSWIQDDGKVYVNVAHAEVELWVEALP